MSSSGLTQNINLDKYREELTRVWFNVEGYHEILKTRIKETSAKIEAIGETYKDLSKAKLTSKYNIYNSSLTQFKKKLTIFKSAIDSLEKPEKKDKDEKEQNNSNSKIKKIVNSIAKLSERINTFSDDLAVFKTLIDTLPAVTPPAIISPDSPLSIEPNTPLLFGESEFVDLVDEDLNGTTFIS